LWEVEFVSICLNAYVLSGYPPMLGVQADGLFSFWLSGRATIVMICRNLYRGRNLSFAELLKKGKRGGKWFMSFTKERLIEEQEKKRICPECNQETLWVEWETSYGKCNNSDCQWEGKVEDCENGYGNVLLIDDEEIICSDCMERTMSE
jgi:hypothetical protein